MNYNDSKKLLLLYGALSLLSSCRATKAKRKGGGRQVGWCEGENERASPAHFFLHPKRRKYKFDEKRRKRIVYRCCCIIDLPERWKESITICLPSRAARRVEIMCSLGGTFPGPTTLWM